MIKKVRFWLNAVTIVSALLQICFFFEETNVFCALIAAVACLLTVQAFVREDLIQKHPVSTVTAFMFTGANMALPLIVSNLEFHPIVAHLNVPLSTFTVMFLVGITVIGAHIIYRTLPGPQRMRSNLQRFNERIQLFTIPSNLQIWLIGFVGLLALFLKAMLSSGDDGGGLLGRILQPVAPFAYAPFLIPLRAVFDPENPTPPRRIATWLLLYFGLILAAAIKHNDRSDFAIAPAIMVMVMALGIIVHRMRPPRLDFRLMAPVLFVALVVYPMLSDLAIAMVVARSQHTKAGAREQVDYTIEAFNNMEQSRALYDAHMNRKTSWDETYYNNNFLGRFANPKYHDNAQLLSQDFNDRDREQVMDFSIGRTWSILPDPILRVFGVNLEKSQFNTMSVGDYFYYLKTGTGLGGFRTGSFISHGLVLFGGLFYPVFAFIMIVYFIMMDSLARRVRLSAPDASRRILYAAPIFSMFLLLNIFEAVNPYRPGDITKFPLYLFRLMPTGIVFYSLLLKGTAWFEASLQIRRRKALPSGGALPARRPAAPSLQVSDR